MMNPHAPHHYAYQGGNQQLQQQVSAATDAPPPPSPCTLLVRRLPEAIPLDTLSRLFSHYGAVSVRPCTHGRVRNCAFVDFNDEVLASQAQRQMHGLQFLGKVLSVERANKGIDDYKHQKSDPQLGKCDNPLSEDAKLSKAIEGPRLNSSLSNEPIAERLGVDYPFPPHLEYSYPPPDGNILTNIVNALISVPRFYTQVLHLMNKMNIPAPFRMALPTPPLPTQEPVSPPPPPPPFPEAKKTNVEDASSSESEMESSDEECPGKNSHRAKRIKREAILGPAVDKGVAHEAVGLKPAALVPKEIPIIKKKNPLLQIKIAPKQIQDEQKGKVDTEELAEPDTKSSDQKPFATPEELKSGRLPPEEILSLPMFKNYTPGNPTPVLYIKNLAKDVVVDDFHFLFGTLFRSIDAAKSSINVKLMQEGRMRGQAFLTFPSIELAQSALNLVNGYVFKGKPVVIQFGRNAAPKAN